MSKRRCQLFSYVTAPVNCWWSKQRYHDGADATLKNAPNDSLHAHLIRPCVYLSFNQLNNQRNFQKLTRPTSPSSFSYSLITKKTKYIFVCNNRFTFLQIHTFWIMWTCLGINYLIGNWQLRIGSFEKWFADSWFD